MHRVSVCPCLSESMCSHPFCMWLHCFDILPCPDLRMTTASSLSWGGISTSFLTRNTCFINACCLSFTILWRHLAMQIFDLGAHKCELPSDVVKVLLKEIAVKSVSR